jgi:hypothetical protein
MWIERSEFLIPRPATSPFAADTGKPYKNAFLAALTPSAFGFEARGLAILAPDAARSAQDTPQKFAAPRLTEWSAAKFGFRLAKLARYAARNIVAKQSVNKFLAASLAGFAKLTADKFHTLSADKYAKWRPWLAADAYARKFLTAWRFAYHAASKNKFRFASTQLRLAAAIPAIHAAAMDVAMLAGILAVTTVDACSTDKSVVVCEVWSAESVACSMAAAIIMADMADATLDAALLQWAVATSHKDTSSELLAREIWI